MFTTLQEGRGSVQGTTVRGDGSSFCADAELALKVLRAQGGHGLMTDLARQHDVDRRRLYELRGQAEAVLDREFNQTRKGDVGARKVVESLPDDRVLGVLPVTVGHVKRASVALRVVAPASLRDIVALLPILFGEQAAWSFGKVQSVLAEAGVRAANCLGGVDLSAVDCALLDEMFSQNRPVFAGLDPATQYLVLLEARLSRSGQEWADALEELRDGQRLNPQRVVKDAGSGLAKRVTAAWSEAEQRDDTFHAIRVFGQARFYLERRALGAISREYEYEERRLPDGDQTERRRAGQQWRQAKDHAVQAIARFDLSDSLCERAQQLLRLTRPGTGELYTPDEVRLSLEAIGQEMRKVTPPGSTRP